MSLNTILATTPNTTSGYVLRATGTTIGNSTIQDDGTNVAIGTTPGTYKFNVSGSGSMINIIGASSGDIATGFRIGRGASLGAEIYDNPADNITTFNTTGGLNFRVGGSNRLTIASTGAATFSSSVTAGGRINSGNGGGATASLNAQQLSGDDSAIYAGGVATAGSSKGIKILAGTNTSDYALNVASYANSPILYARGDGNVGISTSSPSTKLHILDTNPLVVGDSSGSLTVTYETGSTAIGQGGGMFFGIPASSGSFLSTYIKAARESADSSNSAAALVFGTRTNGGSNTERMRITSGGLVGIGTGSPNYALTISGNTDAKSGLRIVNTDSAQTSAARWIVEQYDGKNVQFYVYGGGATFNYTTAGISFYDGVNNATRLLINGSGNLLVGNPTDSGQRMTVNGNITVSLAGSAHLFLDTTPFGGAYAYNMQIKNNAGNGNFYIQRTSDGTGVYIPFGGTSWSGVSDERLKTDLIEISDATNKVSQLRALTGRFKTDEEGTSRSFLIAQDVLNVFPEAVNYDEENDVYGIQYTDVIPLLVKAIQELNQTVQNQQQQINSLINR